MTVLALSAFASLAPAASAIPSPVCVNGDAECDAHEVACVLYPVEACVMDPCPAGGCTTTSADASTSVLSSTTAIPSPVCGPVGEPCGPNEVACVLDPVRACVMDPCPAGGCFASFERDVTVPLLP